MALLKDTPFKIFRDCGQSEFLRSLKRALPKGSTSWYSFYSSVHGGIVTDPHLMCVPMDDHMCHRGHAVFDTCNIHNGNAYGLDMHLDRLFLSAQKARIPPRFSKEEAKTVVLHTLAATGKKDDIFCRYWLSAGRGDFSVSPKNCEGGSHFHVIVHAFKNKDFLKDGTEEWVTDNIPAKPPLLATMKSTNYLINALVAMESEDKGGMLGLQVDHRGRLLESAIANVAIVDKEGRFRTPAFDEILAGTTVRRALALGGALRRRGLLTDLEVGAVTLGDALRAREMIGFGGGGAWPVRRLNGRPVGGGRPGPVFGALRALLAADLENPEFLDPIPYHLYQQDYQEE